MKEIYNTLSQLQVVLAQMFEVEDKIREIPKELADQEDALHKTKITYLELHEKIEKVKEELKVLRVKLDEAGNKRETSEKMMETITQAREFETLQKEIETAKEDEQKYRKGLIAKQNYLEEQEKKLSAQEAVMQNQEEEVREAKEEMDKQIAEKQKELDDIIVRKNELAKDLDPNLLFKFERIIRNKGGKGIVAVHNIVCTGCHMILPAQFVNEVRASTNSESDEDAILFCPYCSRVLFYEDSADYADLEEKHLASEEKDEAVDNIGGDTSGFDTEGIDFDSDSDF